MDNRQKKNILSLIYKTIVFFSGLCMILTTYLGINKLMDKYGVLWLNIVIIAVSCVLFTFVLVDYVFTKKMKNKYVLSKFLYFIALISLIAVVVLGTLLYLKKIDINNNELYALPIILIILCELVLILNFVIGNALSKLNKNTNVQVNSTSEIPNFDDEVLLKKKLDELKRKLEMKKIQDEIDDIEKKLDA